MNYKYRSLLMNIPVRHLINKMKKDDMEKEKQLKMMTDIDLNNIFLLGRKSMIEDYLAVANKLRMYGIKYSWFAMSKVIKDAGCAKTTKGGVIITGDISPTGEPERYLMRLQPAKDYHNGANADGGEQSAVYQTEAGPEGL